MVLWHGGITVRFSFSQHRLCGGEGSEADAVAAAAGEFLVEDFGGVGGDVLDQNFRTLGPV